MSVEIEGIKGYEYQYLVTIYISLLYIEKEFVEIYVEDTEDAKVVFKENNTEITLYIQSKKHTGSISFENLCSWLGHFGSHQSDKFLLSRIAEENCYAVFFSEGRCDDKSSRFVCHKTFENGNGKSFNNEYAENIKNILISQYNANSALSIKRKECIRDFFDKYSNNHIKTLLKKICISEQAGFTNLLDLVSELLNKKFIVPSTQIDYALKRLDECVRNGRDSGENIISDIRKTLNDFSQKILPYDFNYIEIPKHQEYESILEVKNVLLLTGVPFSGKSSLAKVIAQNYAQKGYEVRQTNELDGDNGAFAFFSSYIDDKRLLLLEDPFGSVQLTADKVEYVQKIQKLITEKTAFERKIIITTRSDILLGAFDKMSISDCSINDNHWLDLTIQDISFAASFWKNIYGCEHDSLNYFEKIKIWIQTNESGVFLEIGEISNLKRLYTSTNEMDNVDVNEIINSARISSQVIMDKVKLGGPDSIKAFIALGFCCNTIRSVTINNLAYVLSNAEEKPGLIKRVAGAVRSVSIGTKISQLPTLPQYSEQYKIEPHILNWLQLFEKQGYIFRDTVSKEIWFSHPIFYYASKILLYNELKEQWECDEIILLGTHAISALNKNVNLCALDMLWYCIENNCNFKEQFLDLMVVSLNSIFPASKDKTVILLERYFDKLSTKQQDSLVDTIKEYKFDKYLLWNNNEPFINPNNTIELEWNFKCIGQDSYIDIKNINSKNEHSAQEIYEILTSDISEDLPLNFLNMALLYDESIIREKAIYLLFKNHGNELQDIKKYLRNFDNSNVIYALFRGALESWFDYSSSNKDLIITYFLEHLRRVSVAIQSKYFLETFGDDYHNDSLKWDKYTEDQRVELWTIWCIIFTEFLINCPLQYVNIDEPHMEHTVEQAIKCVKDQDILIDLFNAWNCWLEKCHCPNDYGMSLMGKLLKSFPMFSKKREELFFKMILEKNTSIITSHIRHIVDNWECITQNEKQKVYELLTSDRNDIHWIKSVALTQRTIPAEISNCIFKENIFCKPINEFMTILQKHHLLEYCLNVHCGYPQPLWWNGYHHCNYEIWDRVIIEILKGSTIDQSFEISLREFIDCEYNYERRFAEMSTEIWSNVLLTKEKRKRAFFWLLQVSATQNQANKDVWDRYFFACNDHEIRESYNQIANFIENLEYYQYGDTGIFDLFSKNAVFKYIYPSLDNDARVYSTCNNTLLHYNVLEKIGSKEILQKICDDFEEKIETSYAQYPPRMNLTSAIVRTTAKKIQLSSQKIDDILENHRGKLIDIAHEKEKELNDHYELENWNE